MLRESREHLVRNLGDTSYALDVARRYHARFPANDVVGLTFVRALVVDAHFAGAASELDSVDVLPQEGASEAHSFCRESKLMLAVDATAHRRWTDAATLVAQAREWPERLRRWALARLGRGAAAAGAPEGQNTSQPLTGVDGRVLEAWRRSSVASR